MRFLKYLIAPLVALLVSVGLIATGTNAQAGTDSLWDNTIQIQTYDGTSYFYQAEWCFDSSPSEQDGIWAGIRNDHSESWTFRIRYQSQGGTIWDTDEFALSHNESWTWYPGQAPHPQSVQPQFRFDRWLNGQWDFLRSLNPAALNGSTMRFISNVSSCG